MHKVIPYNLQFSTDIHVQHAMASHGPTGHRNPETARFVSASARERVCVPVVT